MQRRTLVIGVIGIVIGLLLAAAGIVVAGGLLDPANPPGATSSYTLESIYQRLIAGTAGAQSTFAEPAAAPGPTMHTLNDIMNAAPAVDNTNGAAATEVLTGKTFWSLRSGAWGLQTGTANFGSTYYAGVPKTWQTKCYAVNGTEQPCSTAPTGQDGQYQKGVAWPNPRFTDNNNGTVTDNLTGLIWLKNANCFGTQTWANALNAANTLNNGECGLSDGSAEGDWRLPNVRELQSLVHYGFSNPAVPNTAGMGKWVPGDPFTDVQSSNYRSSTTFAGSPSSAWSVGLYHGVVYDAAKTDSHYVWPVRGGP